MSVTPDRSNDDSRPASAGRLEFHVRLPVLPAVEEPQIRSRDEANDPTRGMKVLNGILDKRSRRGWRGLVGRRGPNRFWFLSFVAVGLSFIAVIHGMTKNQNAEFESGDGDVFADDGDDIVVPESAPRPTVKSISRPRDSSDPIEVSGGQPQQGSSVQSAIYETTQRVTAPPAWLDGTIHPDDSHAP
jgi:hypothetical protein